MYTFKANVKQRAFDAASKLLGAHENISIVGLRPDPERCRKLGIKEGDFFTACFFNGKLISAASTKDWRRSYEKLLAQLNDLIAVQPTTR